MGWLGEVVAWFRDPEHWQGPDGVPQRLLEHVGVSAAALGIACLLSIPLALWLGHVRRGGALAVNVSNVAPAVPTSAQSSSAIVPPLVRRAATAPRAPRPRRSPPRSSATGIAAG